MYITPFLNQIIFLLFLAAMHELLLQKFNEIIALGEEEFEICKTLFQPKKLRKRQYLLQEGDVCKYTAFVEKGTLRFYNIDKRGNEHILQFAMGGWWAGDLFSFFSGLPSNYNIDALEDSELLLITEPNYELLLQKIPKLERFYRILIQNNLVATQKRLLHTFSETAESKYENMLKTCPDIFQKAPQHMIASYLGISRETLSRIRSQIAKKKT